MMESHPRHVQVLTASIEHVEATYLKAIGEGPGFPVFWIFDLTDDYAREQALRVGDAGGIERALADAEARGVTPTLVLLRMIAEPYDAGDRWWKGTQPGYFPILVAADGGAMMVARAVPDGIREALRRRLLVEHAPAVVRTYRDKVAADGEARVAVVLADLNDPAGLRAAKATAGEGKVAEAMAGMADWGEASSATMVLAGEPTAASYPSAWGGPIPPGKLAVQVVAHGGASNLLLTLPGPHAVPG
jgi:hypothetical protein